MVSLASAWVKQWIKKRPDWPVSVVLHLVVIAILWQFILPAAEPRVAIETIFARLEGAGDGDEGSGLAFERVSAPRGLPDVEPAGASRPDGVGDLIDPETATASVSNLAWPFDDDDEDGAVSPRRPGAGPTSRTAPRKAGAGRGVGVNLAGILNGRDPAARAGLLKSEGGNDASEKAVEMGLRWLVRNQRSDGSWSFQHGTDDPGRLVCPAAATGFALLSFLGAGHTHKKGNYVPNVQAGLKYMVDHMDVSTNGGWLGATGLGMMYAQAIGTMALCEAYAMTKDPNLRRPAQLAIDYIVNAQDTTGGGWRYRPHDPGDLSVTGWQLMALQSARVAELDIPPQVIPRVTRFIKSVEYENGAQYAYQRSRRINSIRPTMTAVGLLCRMYLGRNPTHKGMRKGLEQLSSIGPNAMDMYYSYYATQAIHHWGGARWADWNAVMRDTLIDRQEKSGETAGSWRTDNSHGADAGGRLYITCLSILTLEVYYRYLSLYRQETIPNALTEQQTEPEAADAADEDEAQMEREMEPDKEPEP